jgi:hypothetical protein
MEIYSFSYTSMLHHRGMMWAYDWSGRFYPNPCESQSLFRPIIEYCIWNSRRPTGTVRVDVILHRTHSERDIGLNESYRTARELKFINTADIHAATSQKKCENLRAVSQ